MKRRSLLFFSFILSISPVYQAYGQSQTNSRPLSDFRFLDVGPGSRQKVCTFSALEACSQLGESLEFADAAKMADHLERQACEIRIWESLLFTRNSEKEVVEHFEAIKASQPDLRLIEVIVDAHQILLNDDVLVLLRRRLNGLDDAEERAVVRTAIRLRFESLWKKDLKPELFKFPEAFLETGTYAVSISFGENVEMEWQNKRDESMVSLEVDRFKRLVDVNVKAKGRDSKDLIDSFRNLSYQVGLREVAYGELRDCVHAARRRGLLQSLSEGVIKRVHNGRTLPRVHDTVCPDGKDCLGKWAF